MSEVAIVLSAIDKTRAAFASVKDGLGGVEKTALSVNGALASLGVSLSLGAIATFITKINEGVDALNDLKDATGASIENISALEDVARRTGGSFDTVSTALIKLNQGMNSAKAGSDVELAIKAIGLSVKDLKDLDSAEAFHKVAIALSAFADDGNKARLTQELFGKSLKEVAPLLHDLAEQGKLVATVTTQQAEEAEKFNKELFVMGKNAQDSARMMIGPLVGGLNEVIAKFREGSAAGKGFWEIAMNRYANNVRGFYGMQEVPLNIGGATGSWGGPTGSWDAPKPSAPDLPDSAAIKSAASAAARALAEQNKELKDQAQLLADLAGLTGSFSEDWDRLSAIYKKGKLSLEGLTKAQADLLAKQPAIKAATDAQAKATELVAKANLEAAEAHGKYIDSLDKGLDKLKAEVLAQQEQNDRLGLSKEAIAALDGVKLDLMATELERQAIRALDKNLDEAEYSLTMQQAKAYRDLVSAKAAGAAKATTIDAAKEAQAEWSKTAEKINGTLTDALMRGFESGKDFAKNLRDTVVNMFKTMVLRPVISAVMNPIAQGVTGMLGLSGAANGASAVSTGASVLSSAGTIGGAASAFSGAFSAGATIGTEAFSAGVTMMTEASGLSSFMAGAGQTLGALGPAGWAAIAVLAVAAIASGHGETRSGAAYVTGADGKAVKQQGPSGGEIAGDQVRAMFDATKTGINDMFNSIGSAATVSNFVAGLETSKNGKGFAYAGGQINGVGFGESGGRDGGQFDFGSLNAEEAIKSYVIHLKQATLQALQTATDIPKLISDQLTGKNFSDFAAWPEAELDKLMGSINTTIVGVNGLRTALDASVFVNLRDLSFATAAGLVAASGGLDKLQTNLAVYYDNFYTETEKTANSTANLSKAFASMGIVMPAIDEKTRAWYRSEVERLGAMDLGIEANAKAFAGVLSLSGAVDGLANAAAAAMATLKQSIASAQSVAVQMGLTTAYELAQKTAQSAYDEAINARPALSHYTQAEIVTYASDASNRPELDSETWVVIDTLVSAIGAWDRASRTELERIATANSTSYSTSNSTSYTARDTSAADEAARRAAEILREQLDLQTQLNALLDTSAQALTRQRDALDESNRAIFDHIQVARRAAEILQEQLGLQTQLNALLDTNAQALARQRDALDASNRAIFDHIQAIKATQAAYTDSKTDTAAAMSAVKRAVDAEKKTLSTQLQAAKSLSSEVGSIFDTLKSAVQDLYGSVENAALQSAAQARSFITNALTGAQATGSLPNGDDLQNAITAATSGISAGQYASQADMDYERLVLANQLSGLKFIAGDQLTEAEHQIKLLDAQLTTLDDQLSVAQAQYDALNGINTSVLSVKDAIDALTAAMTKQAGAGAAQLYATNAAATANPDQTGLDYWSNRIKTDGYDATKPAFDASVAYVNNSNSVKGWYGTTAGATASPDQQGIDYWTQQIQDLGAAQAKDMFEKVVASMNIPKMSAGTNYVPQDMLAFVHEGEEIKPAAWNPVAGGMGSAGNNERLERLVEGLTAEVQRLQSIVAQGNESARTTSDVLVAVKNGSGLNMVAAPTF